MSLRALVPRLLLMLGTCGAVCAAEAPTAAPANPTFAVLEFRVLGNTVLKTTDIETAVYPHLGEGRTFADIEGARTDLENAYHAHGYGTVFVDIPEQTVAADGVVRLRVTEARLRQTQVQGARYFSGRQLRAAIPESEPGTVPDLPVLQDQVYAVNAASTDRSVVPALKAGPRPSTVDLTLNVQDTLPFHGALEANNQYTAGTTHSRALLVLGYDNLFGRLDSLGLQYQMAPEEPREVGVIAASYLARLDDHNSRLSLSYVHSSSNLAAVGVLNIIGKGSIYGMRYIRPLVVDAGQQSQVSVGFDYKDFGQDVRLDADNTLRTPLHYTSLSAAYNVTLRVPGRIITASPSLTAGLSGLGSAPHEFADKCYGCRPNFLVLHFDSAVRQDLFAGFTGVLQAGGQYTRDPVISNEQLSIGGVRSVRGYLEAESLADVGWHGGFELRAPNIMRGVANTTAVPYTFFDVGSVTFQKPLPDQPHSSTLRSLGVGLDLGAFNFIDAAFGWAYPLVDGPQTARGESRWQLSVRTTW